MQMTAHDDGTPSPKMRHRRSVSIEQAGRLLQLSRRTVYYRIREGRLRTIRTLGGSQRVLVESLYANGFQPAAFSASSSAATFAVRSMRD
jgi:excisionase family DNA binding protein